MLDLQTRIDGYIVDKTEELDRERWHFEISQAYWQDVMQKDQSLSRLITALLLSEDETEYNKHRDSIIARVTDSDCGWFKTKYPEWVSIFDLVDDV